MSHTYNYKFSIKPLRDDVCDRLFEDTRIQVIRPEASFFVVSSDLDYVDIRKEFPEWYIKIYVNDIFKKDEKATQSEEINEILEQVEIIEHE